MNRLDIILALFLCTYPWQLVKAQAAVDDDRPAIIYVDQEIEANQCDDYNPVSRRCDNGNFIAFSEIAAAAMEVEPGFSVLIQPGTYTGGVTVRTAGTEAAPIIFQAVAPGVIVEGRGDGRDAFFITEADSLLSR